MKYLYCDSCFIITEYQGNRLDALSQYKEQFYISETQIKKELIKPIELAVLVREAITSIPEDRDEIMNKARELFNIYDGLSIYDCLCMAYCIIDGYCLVTDDKALTKKCYKHNIVVKASKEIEVEYNLEVIDMVR